MKPVVSVVVPIYRVEAYLSRCLDSILMQDYPHWEAILVNDGSSDRSGEIADEYAQKDDRFKVIHQENQGQSAARNKGLDMATGKYIMFLDSDDYWLSQTMLGELVNLAEQEAWDVIIFGVVQLRSHGRRKESERLVESDDTKRIWSDVVSFDRYPSVCNKFFKASLWDRIRLPEGVLAEDFYIMPYVLNRAKRIISWKRIWYAYDRTRENSDSRQVARTQADMLLAWEDRLARLADGTWNIDEYHLKRVRMQTAKAALRLLIRIEKGDTVSTVDQARAKRLLHTYGGYLTKWKYRGMYWLYRHMRWIYR